jgi:hypothetical protein
MEEIYELDFEMGLGSMIHILSFIKVSSGIQKLIGGNIYDLLNIF